MKYSTFSLVVVAMGAAATGSAFSQVSSRGISVHPGVGSVTATGPEQDFVKAVAVFAKFSVIAGQLAMLEAREPRTRELASLMVKDYTIALKKLRAVAGHTGVALPVVIGPDEAYRAKIAAVRSEKGAAFDLAYRREQLDALQEAAEIMHAYAKTGSDSQLRTWAAQAFQTVQKHQQHLKVRSEDDHRP